MNIFKGLPSGHLELRVIGYVRNKRHCKVFEPYHGI
jgi:hypothetical protein